MAREESQRTPTRKRKAKEQPVEEAVEQKGSSASNVNSVNSNEPSEKKSHPLLRDETKGMNPVSLLTGYYGTRGERIRHVAQTGALHLPKEALDILLARANEAKKKETTTGGTKKKVKGPNLPGLDSVVRTSLDHANLESMVVTKISKIKTTVTPQPVRISNPDGTFQFQQPPEQVVWKDHVQNKTISLSGDETVRIRGGGGDDGSQQPPSQPISNNAPAAGAPISAQPQQQQTATVPTTQPAQPTLQQPTVTLAATMNQAPAAPQPALAKSNDQKIQEQQMQLKKLHQQSVQARQQQQLEQLRRQHEQSMHQMQQDETKKRQEEQARAQQAQKQQLIQRQQEQLRAQHEQIRKQQAEQQQQRLVQQQSTTQQPNFQKSAVSGTIPMTQAGPPQPAANPVITTASAPAATTGSLVTPMPAQQPVAQPAQQQPMQTQITASTSAPVATPVSVASAKTAPQPAAPTQSQPSSASQPAGSQESAKPPSQRGVPVAIGLKKVPEGQWEQHTPGPNDEMAVDPSTKAPKPEWYKSGSVSDLEMTLLPEWFDGSAVHRTKETYMKGREAMMKISSKLGTRYLTATMARRSIPGDAGSLIRLHKFLEAHGLINEDSVNDSAPTPVALQAKSKEQVSWPLSRRHALVKAVVEQSRKRTKIAGEGQDVLASLDWKSIADEIGDGATSDECEKQFLIMDIEEEPEVDNQRSITPETTPATTSSDGAKEKPESETDPIPSGVSKDWIDSCDPQVVHAVTEAALTNTASLSKAQKAAIGALELSHDLQDAVSQEGVVARLLSEVVELRMKKLENRLALLDDVEGLLDAERVALELERRDLYTSRCRHWFGGA